MPNPVDNQDQNVNDVWRHLSTRSRDITGNLSAAKSNGSVTLQEILADPEIVGLCPAGVNLSLLGSRMRASALIS
jgi:hypothetical protein